MTTTTNVFPIGAVVASAGPIKGNAISTQGWLLCDGSTTSATTYGALSSVIGAYYGASGAMFAVPDYGGRFLRGVDSNTGRDPDAAARTAPQPAMTEPGNTGSRVGSVQACAWPSHTHSVTRHDDHHDTIWQAPVSNDTYDIANDTAQTRTSTAAGGSEVRPVNQSACFVIKAANVTSGPEVIPGTVVAYAGDLSTSAAQDSLSAMGWLLCDGRSLATATYGALFGVLGDIYGGSDTSHFCVPRYEGQFLRGFSSTSCTVDPDASSRSAPRPDLALQGATGNNVGSVQSHAFPCHTHTYPGHDTDHELLVNPGLEMCDVSNASYTTVDTGSAGSGPETRPKNIALEYIVAWTNQTSTSPAATFQVPSGVVIAYAGDVADPDVDLSGWLVCDGAPYGTTAYPALFAAIGYAHGGGDQCFNVPDLRGRFVRGVDHGTSVDPGPRSAPVSGANASGVGSYEADATASHTHSQTTHMGQSSVVNNPESTSLKTDTVTDVTAAPALTSTQAGKLPSGAFSTETRPVNSNVYFLIKS